jgi:hypothetical protein
MRRPADARHHRIATAVETSRPLIDLQRQHLVKPVDVDQLIAAIASCRAVRHARSASGAAIVG